MKVESYGALKSRHQKAMDEFQGIFFAFNNNQFKEGMAKVGLKEKDTKSIFSLGGGGYILKTRSKDLKELLDSQGAESKQRNKDEKFLVESIAYELANHEYCITGDTSEALDALELDKDELDPKTLKKAIIKHNNKRR